MKKIIYVTGNYGKYISVKEEFDENGLSLDFYKYEFNEPEVNDIEEISKNKVLEAYNILKKPCFVADTGFYIDKFPNNLGFPGAFVKRSGVSSNIDNLLDIMKNEKNRNCQFIDCLTFYDGFEFYTFYGVSKGKLSFNKRGNSINKALSNLWYVFIPQNCYKTLAEMSDDERKNRPDGHVSATALFIDWYQTIYMKKKTRKL